jgi:branched-chain amino acid transport system substrate-binding protein
MSVRRRTLLSGIAALGAVFPLTGRAAPATGEPILLGVSGPLTGPMAQYGAQWKRGFDLALEEVNGNGGVKGRPLQYVFEDSQADPRQSVGIAQKFVADPKIVMELGDFASPASMAASPVYQRGKLVQFGFTNSHPDFTKGGDYMWSNSTNQAEEQPKLAEYVVKALGLKRPAVLYLNTDWGRTAKDAFVKAAAELGATVVATEGYLPTEQDFRPTLVRARDANPDGLVGLSYYADGALIARQARDTGLKLPIVEGTSVYSPKLLELGGDAVNGLYTFSTFFPEEPRAEVQNFVKRYREKYGVDPDTFSAGAYDTIILVYHLCDQFGPTRAGIHEGLGNIRDVPSVIYGKVQFSTETRRIPAANYKYLQVKDGKFVMWDGRPVQAGG